MQALNAALQHVPHQQHQQHGHQPHYAVQPRLQQPDLDALLAHALHVQLAAASSLPLQVRVPTPQDLLELSYRIYKPSRKLFAEADAQGLRVHRDELIAGDVRLVMAVPSWMPKPGVQFDWDRVQWEALPVVLVVRGTVQDLVGNTRANLELIYNKLVDNQHLPDVAQNATSALQGWLLELYAAYPLSRAGKKLHVHITGHSLGGFVAEAATVMSDELAAQRGWSWRCISYDAPGLPDHYVRSALRRAPRSYWRHHMTSYLAAPNPVNMLYEHLGALVHVLVPFEQTWSHVAKCIGADTFRIAGWALVAAASFDSVKQVLRSGSGSAASAATALPANIAASAVEEELVSAASGAAAAAGAAAVAVPAVAAAAAAPSATAVAAPAAELLQQVPRTLAGGLLDLRAPARRLLSAPSPAHPPSLGAAAAAGVAGAASAVAGGDAGEVRRAAGCGLQLGGLVGWLWGMAAGSASVAECLAGVLGVEVDELVAQHGLDGMRPCFDAHSGELQGRYRRDMRSWPQLGAARHEVLLSAVGTVVRWTLPSFICPENVGFMSIAGRSAMVEARCARLKGYVVASEDASTSSSWAEEEDKCWQREQEHRQRQQAVLFGDLAAAERAQLEQQQRQGREVQRARQLHEQERACGSGHAMNWIVAEPPPEQQRQQRWCTDQTMNAAASSSSSLHRRLPGARLVAAVGQRIPFLAMAQ